MYVYVYIYIYIFIYTYLYKITEIGLSKIKHPNVPCGIAEHPPKSMQSPTSIWKVHAKPKKLVSPELVHCSI